jgi:hypothetical protein
MNIYQTIAKASGHNVAQIRQAEEAFQVALDCNESIVDNIRRSLNDEDVSLTHNERVILSFFADELSRTVSLLKNSGFFSKEDRAIIERHPLIWEKK